MYILRHSNEKTNHSGQHVSRTDGTLSLSTLYCSQDQEAEVPKILHNLSRNLVPLKVRHTLEIRDTVGATHNACPCGLAGRFKQDCTESRRTQTAGTLSTVTMTYEL